MNISGLYSSENNLVVNFDRPVKAVALDPEFYRSNSKQFVTGDDKLILNEKGFFGSQKRSVIHQGEGAIREIQWKGDLIAWANDFVSIVKNVLLFISYKFVKGFLAITFYAPK